MPRPEKAMIRIRRSDERGTFDHGWLKTKHTFSFAEYYEPALMGFRTLRVINEDLVDPGEGFGRHPHRDMEIISYVLEGGLQHQDSTGGGGVIVPGDVQRMTPGTGVVHSEFNASSRGPVHFLQIWVLPSETGLTPGYEEKNFSSEMQGKLALIASRDGRDGSLTIHQDAEVRAARLDAGVSVEHATTSSRGIWVQNARGTIVVNGETLAAGDGASIEEESMIAIRAEEEAEFLLFDLG